MRRLGDLRGRAAWIVFRCFVCQLGLGYGYVFGPLRTDVTEDLGLARAAFSSSQVATTFSMALARSWREAMPTIYGVLMSVLLLASKGGIFAGWALDHYGRYDLAYGSFAALNLLVLTTLVLLRRETARPAAYTAAP